jgi:hypothetical protein
MVETSLSASPERVWRKVIVWIALFGIAGFAVRTGIDFRHWWFRTSIPVHFSDIERNWLWGAYTYYNIHDKGRSFLDTYDDVGIQDRNNRLWIDYAPARLAVNTLWVAYNHQTLPYQWIKRWNTTKDLDAIDTFYSFYRWFNTTIELLGVIAAFLLVHQVVRKTGASLEKSVGLGFLSGLLLWFNVAMINSAHGWPSGDIWIIPPFLWSVYFCRIDRWFLAGMVLGIGALFKGQQLFVMSVLILWPVFQGRWKAPLEMLLGFMTVFGLVTSGWTLTYIDDFGFRHLHFPATLTSGAPLILGLSLFILKWTRWSPKLAQVSIFPLGKWVFGLMGTLSFASMWVFGTCYAWFDASYLYGTDHWPKMIVGVTSNLPGLLQKRYGWSADQGPSVVVFQIVGLEITLRVFLLIILGFFFVLSGWALARQDKRNSTRFLVALVTPWLAFYAIPCQIHERYLLFAAGVASICIGHSLGTALLGLFCTVLTTLMTWQIMFRRGDLNSLDRLLHESIPWLFDGDGFVIRLNQFIRNTHPDIGWAVLVVLGVFSYVMLTPLTRRNRANCRKPLTTSGDSPNPAYIESQI